MYPFKRQTKNFSQEVYRQYGEKIYIYLSAGQTKHKDYDKYRNTGYVVKEQPPIVVTALVSDVKANELIMKSIGLTEIGAKRLTIKEKDIQFFKVAKRIVYNNQEFYVYNDAVGGKMQVQIGDLGDATIVIFQRPNK